MTKREKTIISLSCAFALIFGVVPVSHGMHIMEGYLPLVHCLVWGAISVPFVVVGIIKIRKLTEENRRTMVLIAMAGAFVFVLSSLKIPSVTGSCSHMTGTGLGAVLFGPAATSVLGIIVLLFQAILLAHGGLTTLGANTFSMAIGGPFLTWIIWKGLKGTGINKPLAIFLATALGDLFTYCITSFQLAFAYPSETGGVMASVAKFLGIFAATQVPLAIIEGILSALVYMALMNYAKPEMRAIGLVAEK
ncbi:MAG: energy-coupling factor ABC transporter permease [Clostridiales bacterium]|nr:energy-coupling factor ABC transporter permease [Clostridiales bacterium]MDD7347204.1 energy-coupling factor ABC transporter permease [Clostridiales bacterium]MDY4061185.1 energy-coupling factor ABC transporter permease [Anaerovoracaceae bacterium]